MPAAKFDVTVVLAREGRQRSLSTDESQGVLAEFAAVRREASKWSQMTQRPGRLVVVDPCLVSEIERFLSPNTLEEEK